jgi:hypothetical protein
MNNLNIKDLDHLGIVAGIIDEMGLVEIIDEEVGTRYWYRVIKARKIYGVRL